MLALKAFPILAPVFVTEGREEGPGRELWVSNGVYLEFNIIVLFI